MKMRRAWRFAAAVLALVFVLGLLPVSASAAEIVDSGTLGSSLIWTLDSDGTLTVSGSGGMGYYFMASSFPWYGKRKDVKCVVIGQGVTSIGSYAFDGCSGLTDVTIPASVTSIGNSAFSGCTGLTGVTIPASVISIGNSAFSGCTGLTGVTIPESVTSIGDSAFYGCSSLTSVTIPAGVTSIGGAAFASCGRLQSISVAEANSSFCSMDGVLFSKDGTTLVAYPSGKSGSYVIPEGVTGIGDYVFYGCSGITGVTIPASVTSVGFGAFAFCERLPAITAAEANPAFRSVDGVLFSKDGMTLVAFPAGKDSSYLFPNGVTGIGSYAFSGCTGLTGVTVPEGVTSIGDYAFYGCSNLTTVTIPESVTFIGNGTFEFCFSLTSVTIPNGVTSIGYGAFGLCFGLTDVTIPKSVTSIGYQAFIGCYRLTVVYYDGSEGEWNAISIGTDNEPLLNAAIHYGGDSDQPAPHNDDQGEDSVRIVSVTPEMVGRGSEVRFSVTVEYSLQSRESGILYLGVNTNEERSYNLYGEAVVSKGSGTAVLTANVTTAGGWDTAIYVNLSEYPHAESWQPLSFDTLQLANNGSAAQPKNGLVQDPDGVWRYNKDDVLQTSYTGLAENENGWWYVFNGELNLDYTGLATNENGTFYVYKGQLADWRTGYEWVNGEYCEFYKGQLTTWKEDAWVVDPNGDGNWTAMRCGKVDPTYTGIGENENGVWYLTNGKIDFDFIGLQTNDYGSWYIYKGQLVTWHGEEIFGDWVDGEYHMFYKGQLTTWDTYPKLVYPGGAIEEWVPVIGGNLAPDFTGIAVNDNGYWYVFNGHMDFDYTGLTTNADGTWYVYKGQLVTWKDGIQYIESEGKNYYIYQGQLAEWHSGDIEEGGVVYHVTNGVVTGWN